MKTEHRPATTLSRSTAILLGGLALSACGPPEGDGPDDPSVETRAQAMMKLEYEASEGGQRGPTQPPCAVTDHPAQCFGAIGISCDGIKILPGGTFHGCDSGGCVINAGSWEHDECCARNPSGQFCRPENMTSACSASWWKAVLRVGQGLSWRRAVDQCRIDGNGSVDFAEYGAPNGTIVAAEDADKCCGQNTRPFDLFYDAARAAAQGVLLPGTFTPVVCQGDVAPGSGGGSGSRFIPSPTPCQSSADCRADEICLRPSGSLVKVCLAT